MTFRMIKGFLRLAGNSSLEEGETDMAFRISPDWTDFGLRRQVSGRTVSLGLATFMEASARLEVCKSQSVRFWPSTSFSAPDLSEEF